MRSHAYILTQIFEQIFNKYFYFKELKSIRKRCILISVILRSNVVKSRKSRNTVCMDTLHLPET